MSGGCKGTTFLNPPNFRGINLLKIFKVDHYCPIKKGNSIFETVEL